MMAETLDEEAIKRAFANVTVPGGGNLLSSGRVSGVSLTARASQ